MSATQVFRAWGLLESATPKPVWERGKLHVGNYKPPVSYGTFKPDTTSVTGIHYSHLPRKHLSGSQYGQGMRGAESKRLANQSDKRISKRVHFYVDEGKGIRPEAGVGHVEHAVNLHGLYDARKNPKKYDQSNWSSFESKVVDDGHPGIYVSKAQGDHGVAVLLGDQHEKVPVERFDKTHK